MRSKICERKQKQSKRSLCVPTGLRVGGSSLFCGSSFVNSARQGLFCYSVSYTQQEHCSFGSCTAHAGHILLVETGVNSSFHLLKTRKSMESAMQVFETI